MEHSPTGASTYYRWKACPQSVRLSKGLPAVVLPEGIRGKRAHELAKVWIQNRHCPKNMFQDLEQEDFDAVETYISFIDSLLGERNDPDLRYFIETKVDLSSVYPGLWGTPDFVCYSNRHEKLIVVDYKHGMGLPVEAKENLQLQYYGIGAILQHHFTPKSVELVIVQPRSSHREGSVRKWQTTPKALEDFLGQLVSDAKKTEDPSAAFNPGRKQCGFCPAAAVNCPKIREKMEILLAQGGDISEALELLPVFERWMDGLKRLIGEQAIADHPPQGYKIVDKPPLLRWKEGWTGERLAQEFGLKPPEMFDTKLRRPEEVRKMVSEGLRDKVMDLVDLVHDGYKLVEKGEPGQALSPNEVDSFGKVEV